MKCRVCKMAESTFKEIKETRPGEYEVLGWCLDCVPSSDEMNRSDSSVEELTSADLIEDFG